MAESPGASAAGRGGRRCARRCRGWLRGFFQTMGSSSSATSSALPRNCEAQTPASSSGGGSSLCARGLSARRRSPPSSCKAAPARDGPAKRPPGSAAAKPRPAPPEGTEETTSSKLPLRDAPPRSLGASVGRRCRSFVPPRRGGLGFPKTRGSSSSAARSSPAPRRLAAQSPGASTSGARLEASPPLPSSLWATGARAASPGLPGRRPGTIVASGGGISGALRTRGAPDSVSGLTGHSWLSASPSSWSNWRIHEGSGPAAHQAPPTSPSTSPSTSLSAPPLLPDGDAATST
mmetsp:Transcript_106448/g.308039  ORF Transcript_106448/g.308039 Transcript_106448/m.308039 type:complete len:291 (+) Transcript_106448:1872-2744(+)